MYMHSLMSKHYKFAKSMTSALMSLMARDGQEWYMIDPKHLRQCWDSVRRSIDLIAA